MNMDWQTFNVLEKNRKIVTTISLLVVLAIYAIVWIWTVMLVEPGLKCSDLANITDDMTMYMMILTFGANLAIMAVMVVVGEITRWILYPFTMLGSTLVYIYNICKKNVNIERDRKSQSIICIIVIIVSLLAVVFWWGAMATNMVYEELKEVKRALANVSTRNYQNCIRSQTGQRN
jgi:hypothetical protein